MRSNIGLAVWIIDNKVWGAIPVNGRPRSQKWWRQYLQQMIDEVEEPITPENLAWLGESNVEIPVPFEVEYGMPDLNYDTFFEAWRRMEK